MKNAKLYFLIIIGYLGLACMNTSYSRKDEKHITGKEIDLILGQFAHHGKFFYEHELIRTNGILEKSTDDFTALNDKASALLKLKRYPESEALFLDIDKRFPNEYKVHSNLGVLYKKMEIYDLAANEIETALKIKPGGHMGLGDYYLRMIKWLGEKKLSATAKNNFLGIPYADGYETVQKSDLVNKDYLLTLIKNDMNFTDVYFVLGDLYFAEKDMQLAIRAYSRAVVLKHPRSDLAKKRINEVIKYWGKNKEAKHVVMQSWDIHSQIDMEFYSANEWLNQFQDIEKQQIDGDGDLSFQALLKLSQEKPVVKEVGYFKGTSTGGPRDVMMIIVTAFLIIFTLFVACVYIVYKRYKKRKLAAL